VAQSFTRGPVLVEAYILGNDYRLMVVGDRLRATIRRDPPHVVGDGVKTVAELVMMKNIGRDIRSPVRSGYLWPIVLDASACLHLAGHHLMPQTVLAKNQRITVRSNSNLSTGGNCTDVSDSVHPFIQRMAETLASTLNLNMMGADYQTSDISQSPYSTVGGFIEINTTPGFSALMAAGWSAKRAGALALDGDLGRITSTLMVVPDIKFAVLEKTLQCCTWPMSSGWASKGVAHLGDMPLKVQSFGNPWAGVSALVSHRLLSHIVIVATLSELYQHALPLEQFDSTLLFTNDLRTQWLATIENCSAKLTYINDEIATITPQKLQQIMDF